MFWGKRAKSELKGEPTLQALATQLGVERRVQARVRYPLQSRVCRLPEIHYQGHQMTVQNISVGGCCLLDPNEYLGPAIGHEIELHLHWSTTVEAVQARIVSRVDHRRHIQFLSLSQNRQVQLVKSMTAGVRALSMTRAAAATEIGPSMHAAELWSSPLGDSLVLENDIHRIAQIHLLGEQFTLYREAWPSKSGARCTRAEFENIVLFVANIGNPSAQVRGLQKYLEDLIVAGLG